MSTRPVYSTLFAHSGPYGDGAVAGPVPSGFVWVIRDIVVASSGGTYLTAAGFSIQDNEGAYLFSVHWPYARLGRSYHWSGHQVLDAGDQLTFHSGDVSTWYWRVSGYQLSTP